MKKIYASEIFNWVLLIISVVTLIDTSYLLTREFEFLNVLVLRIVLFVVPVLSIVSFFTEKLRKEFYSRLFILVNLIALPVIIYYQFLVDQFIYMVTRTDLISSPAIHVKFLIGIILFYLSLKFSKTTKAEKQREYGIVMMIFGGFLILISVTKIVDSVNFSMIQFAVKLVLSFGIIYIGNRLRNNNLKFKTAMILAALLAIISGMV